MLFRLYVKNIIFQKLPKGKKIKQKTDYAKYNFVGFLDILFKYSRINSFSQWR